MNSRFICLNSLAVSITLSALVGSSAFAVEPATPAKPVTKKLSKKTSLRHTHLQKKASLKKASPKVSGIDKASFTTTETTNLQAPTVAPTSTASVQIESPKKKELPISVNANSTMYGPSVSSLDSSAIPDDSIDSVTGIYNRTQIGFRYHLAKRTHIQPVLDFEYQITDPSISRERQKQFRWKDCFIRLSRSGLFETQVRGNSIALDGDIRYYAPTSLGSRTSNSLGSVRLSLNPSLQLAKSPVSFSMVNYARYWLQTQETGASGNYLNRTQLYTGPQVNYSFNDRVTAFFLYEASVVFDTLGRPDTRFYSNSNTDIEPGVDIRVHDRVTLTPFLNWFTNQRLSTTSVNLTANIQLL